MTAKEALQLLEHGPPNSDGQSKVILSFTQGQVHEIVTKGIASYSSDTVLSDLMEKRVYQAIRNQRRPRF